MRRSLVCLPDPDGTALLHAALDPPAAALAKWHEVRPRLDPAPSATPSELHRLLPLVYVNLPWAGSGATTRWIADAVTVLRAAPSIDADRILAVADEHQVGALLGDALGHLAIEHGAAPVLGDLPAQLRAQRVSRRRRLRQRALTAPPDRHASLDGLAHLRAYWAYTRWEWSDARARRDGPHFLAELWGADRPAALPATAWQGLRRRLGHRDPSA